MFRGLTILTTIFSLFAGSLPGQATGVLRIRIALMDRERKATPVPRHVLLISDNPTSAPPRRVVTAADGTAEVRLPPGNYTVESDQPVAFQGRAYQWTQLVDIAVGRDAVLELTADNAEVGNVGSAASAADAAPESDPAFLLTPWQNSVVSIWTATTHASGFLVDSGGLIATNQRSIDRSTSVEVQLTPEIKVAGTVLVADPRRNVAMLRIDPSLVALVRPVPLACPPEQPAVHDGQQIYAVEAPLRQEKATTSGIARRVDTHAIASDLMLGTGAAGGPVFTAAGRLIGLTDDADDSAGRRRGDARVVRVGEICDAIAAATQKMKQAEAPKPTRLPVEPTATIPADALDEAVRRRVGTLNPYQIASSDFDIAFLTPVVTYGALHPPSPQRQDQRGGGTRVPDTDSVTVRPLTDFGNWSEYVDGSLPVLLVRVTPKLVEGFWTKVARGAAQTQGVALPPIKRVKSGFLRMRAYCGDAEVVPIHPLKLEHRTLDNEAIYEGLYVFDPAALAPSCKGVKLVLYSDKEPEKGDARIVDPKLMQQIWQDFESFRP
jgi:S1-C subfamily serine protease